MGSHCNRFSRCFTLFIGLIFWAVAGGLLYVGIKVFLDYGDVDQFKHSKYVLTPAVIMLAIAGFFFISGLIGCCGAFCDNRCLMGFFGFLVLVIFMFLVAAGVLGLVYRDDAEKEVQNEIMDLVKNYKEGDPTAIKDLDFIQQKYKCCGAQNSSSSWDPETIPDSCIEKKGDPLVYYQDGCFKKMKEMVLDNFNMICGVSLGLAGLMLIGVILACALACRKKEVPYVTLSQTEYKT